VLTQAASDKRLLLAEANRGSRLLGDVVIVTGDDIISRDD